MSDTAKNHEVLQKFTTQELFNELDGREDVAAVKMWTRTDIFEQASDLVSDLYPELMDDLDEIVDIAMSGDYDYLKDCTDEEWDHIASQIIKVAQEVQKERDEENEKKEEHDGEEEERVSEHTARA